MTTICTEALTAVKDRIYDADPLRYGMVVRKTAATALQNPDDPINRFYCSLLWPTEHDPFSYVELHANFPGERLKTGYGYLGLTFVRQERTEPPVFETELKIKYSIGKIGLIEPIDAECGVKIVDFSDIEARPRLTPATPDAVALVLGKFGIKE